MSYLIGFILGVIVATAGLTWAQFFDAYDNAGNHLSGYTDQFGHTTWQDNQGQHGQQYSNPEAPVPYLYRNPC